MSSGGGTGGAATGGKGGASGGARSSGGASNSGGTGGSAGATGSGGVSTGGAGGALGSGGSSTGGLSGSGGSPGAGGSQGSGGLNASGGSPGSGGSSSSCQSGAARCSSTIPTLRQTCVAGAWIDDSAACSGSTPTCFSGVCVVCNPGATQCASGAQPQLCVSGAWTNSGSACSGSSPVCLSGSCAACSPNATQCAGGTQPQTCSAAGAWQNNGSPVTHSNGIGQTWQDCVPLGTYNLSQAMKACKAANSGKCVDSQGCGAGQLVVLGWNTAGTQLTGSWGYGGFPESFACSANSGASCGCVSSGPTWN